MDKSRDMRRGASRFSRQINKQSGHKLLSGFDGVAGDSISLEKSKKEKVRKLSAVNGRGSPSKEESEMGCSDLSDRENECPSQSQSIFNNATSKRFKIPKKFFDDCNVVDHASVPRKLRSAMKKRNRESISPPLPDSKRLNHTLGEESPQKDGVNKPKLNLKQRDSEWSRKQSVSGPITKDEEEVVETLYALAGMFPDNDTIDKNKLDNESLEGKPSAPPETVESPAIKVKMEVTSVGPTEAAKAAPSVNLEMSPTEAVKINPSNGTSTEEWPDLTDGKKFRMEPADGSFPQVSLNGSMSSLAKVESSDRKPPSIPGDFHGLPELSWETGLKLPKQQVTTPIERKPEIAFGVASIEVQQGQEYVIKEARQNGVTLWPGLSSTVPVGAGTHGPSESFAAKLPGWLESAVCPSRPSSSQNGTSAREVSDVTTYRKSMKRCAAHVYISRLIRSLQMSESKESVLEHIELKHQEGLKQAVVMPHNDLTNVRNGINGALSCISLTTNKNPYEAGSGNYLQHKNPQVAQVSVSHTSHKQYDFFSLSAGGGGEEINNCSNKAGNAFDTLSQHKVADLHSLPQHQSLVAFSLPQAHSTFSTYSDQLSVAVASAQQGQLQLPPYLSSPFYGPYTSHSGMGIQQPQQVQLQQRLLAAQFAAHCRATGTSTALTQFPSWKNGKRESSAPTASVRAIIPPSPLSLDALGPKYSAVPQHQQRLVPISSSLPPSKVKRQDQHLPFVYEESGAGFRAGGAHALPMQLLCNERL